MAPNELAESNSCCGKLLPGQKGEINNIKWDKKVIVHGHDCVGFDEVVWFESVVKRILRFSNDLNQSLRAQNQFRKSAKKSGQGT